MPLSTWFDVQPNSADLWAYYSLFLTYSGRPEGALKAIKEAIRLNPRGAGPRHPLFLGFAYTGLERYQEAIRHLGKGSKKCSARVPVVLTFCITAYMGAGRVEEAKAAAQRLLAIRPKFSRSAWVRIFKKPEDRNRILAAMARAGVPE